MLLSLATLTCWAVLDITSKTFVELNFAGIGRYGTAPAVFLEESRGGPVLPLPIPRAAEMAFEQAVSPTPPAMFEVLLHARSFSNRDDGLFDRLPWQWNANNRLAKRDAYSMLSGRDYPRGANRPQSPFHLLLEAIREHACADVTQIFVINEEDAAEADERSVVVGGRLLLERRLPSSGVSDGLMPRDAGLRRAGQDEADAAEQGKFPCYCTLDEGLGLAIALPGGECTVQVETSVWEAARLPPRYRMLRGNLRLCVDVDTNKDDRARLTSVLSRSANRDAARLPWEFETLEALEKSQVEEKALAMLGAGLLLPRGPGLTAGSITDDRVASSVNDETLIETMEPLLDAGVRRELRARRAREEGMVDENELFTLETALKRREELERRMGRAAEAEEYQIAAKAQAELLSETEYLDELLDSMPRPAFTVGAQKRYAAAAGEEAEEGALEAFLDVEDGGGEEWYERTRERARERRLDIEFSVGFISDFRGQLQWTELLRSLDDARAAYLEKEAVLRKAAQEAAALREAAAQEVDRGGVFSIPPSDSDGDGDGSSSVRWDTRLAYRVARQLVFASDNPATDTFAVRESVSKLDKLIETAGRGETAAQESLKELADLTSQLEALQVRRRGGAEEGQVALEEERRELVARLRVCAGGEATA